MKKFGMALCALLAVWGGCSKADRTDAKTAEADSDDFYVLAVTPQGELPDEVKFPSIQVQFSEPVIPLGALGKPSAKSDIVTIEPPLKGVFRWYGTSLLSFECEDAVAAQHAYTVKINPKTRSLVGKAVTGALTYSFHTEALRIISVIPGYGSVKQGAYIDSDAAPLSEARDIGVYFNAPVNPDVLKEYIRVTAEKPSARPLVKEDCQFDIAQEDAATVRLTLKNDSRIEEDALITVRLIKGARADTHTLPLTEEAEGHSFRTIGAFAKRSVDFHPGYFGGDESNPVAVVFSYPLKAGQEAPLAKRISASIQKELTADNIALHGKLLVVHGLPVEYESAYTLTLQSGLQVEDIYGRTFTLDADEKITVKVGKARSFAQFKGHGLQILEAAFPPRIAFQMQNVQPGSCYSVRSLIKQDAKILSVPTLFETLPRNKKILQILDLSPFLTPIGSAPEETGYRGAALFDATIFYEYSYKDWKTQEEKTEIAKHENRQIIQVSDLGLTVRFGHNKAAVLVTSMKSGEPVQNAEVTVHTVNLRTDDFDVAKKNYPTLGKARTDANGFAVISFPEKALSRLSREAVFVAAETKDDRVIFRPQSHNPWRFTVEGLRSPEQAEEAEAAVFLFTDRGLYKPGETLSFRGIDRTLKNGEYASYRGQYRIVFEDADWEPQTYAAVDGTIEKNGSFWGSVRIPDSLKPGSYRLTYRRVNSAEPANESTPVQIQFFERLRFEVTSSIAPLAYYSGDSITARITAQYLGGGNLDGSPFSAYWSREAVGFRPEGAQLEGFTFGPETGYDGYTVVGSEDGALSSDGSASVTNKTGGEKLSGTAYSYRMEADISDSGGQHVASVCRALVHPARFYIGLSPAKNTVGFPEKGRALKFDYVCVTPEGEAPSASDLPRKNSGKLKVQLLREEWKQVQQLSWNGELNTRYDRELVSEQTAELPLSGSRSRTEFSITPPKGGSYLLRLSATDSAGRAVITERQFYVFGSDWSYFNRSSAQEITLIPDKKRYKAGDTARILMQSPLPKGKYLITLEREGIISEEVRDLAAPTSVIDIKIEENYVPIVYAAVSSYSLRSEGPAKDFNTRDLGKPKGYFGLAPLYVDTAAKRFDIAITTDKPSYRPGQEATITLRAAKDGKALADSEITLMAVDRGVIDLIDYRVPDPVSFFYAPERFPLCVGGGDSRALLMDPVTYEVKNLTGGDSRGNESKFETRKNFEPTALFIPNLVTDRNGEASCTFTLPDSLTAYRITAVGVHENRFAFSEGQMNVANPLSARAALPQMLRLSDAAEAGLTLSNREEKAHEVSVELRVLSGTDRINAEEAEGDLVKIPGEAEVRGKSRKKISVAGGKTEAISFTVQAKKAGWITLEYVIESEALHEKILLPLEIEKPSLFETVTAAGEVRANAAEERLILPEDAEDGRLSLTVQLDPTQLGMLREAVQYVFHYPYGCLEQRSSAVLPLIIFGDAIKAFGLKSEVKNPVPVIKKEVKAWAASQKPNGGFPYWPNGRGDSPFVSARIAEIIGIAEKNGIALSKTVDTDALYRYLIAQAERLAERKDTKNGGYDVASLCYAASLLRKNGALPALTEIKEASDTDIRALSLCALAHLNAGRGERAAAIAKKMRRFIKLTTQGADISDTATESAYWPNFNDSAEKFALCLHVFSALNAEDEINRHLLYELLQLQKASKGYWQSTATTARALSAIDAYIRANKLKQLNVTAKALLNGEPLVSAAFHGMTAEAAERQFDFKTPPLDSAPKGRELPLTFKKSGTGSLFYTASMKYALPAAKQTARDEGISLFTDIIDVKTGSPALDGKLKAGRLYRQKIFVSTTKARAFVAVRAPVPAGCEIINAAFATTGTAEAFAHANDSEDDEAKPDAYDYGLSYQGIYDAEVQYFWNFFPRGNTSVEFLFRAVRKGSYGVPAATAECMYEEAIFGRTAGIRWTIE